VTGESKAVSRSDHPSAAATLGTPGLATALQKDPVANAPGSVPAVRSVARSAPRSVSGSDQNAFDVLCAILTFD